MGVTSYPELMREQARSAVKVSGAHHSSWNGRIGVTAPERKVRGAVTWNEDIEYSDAKVNEPLKEMFGNARVYNQDAETLQWYREAVKTVFHENTHLLAAEGTNHRDAMYALADPSAKVLEEGITEVYSYDNLNEYIDDLGLEEIAPGIKSADAHQSYRQFTPAARRFAEGIGRETGIESGEVARQLAVVNGAQKFRVAAELLYDNSELPGIVPEGEREGAIQRIEAAMKPPLAGVDNIPQLDQAELRRQSAKAGADAALAGIDVVDSLKSEWSTPAPEQQVQRGAAQNRGPQQSAGPTRLNEPIEAGATQAGRPALPPDLAAAARVGLGGSAPLSSASRLAPSQQGSRTSTGTGPGTERQQPAQDR